MLLDVAKSVLSRQIRSLARRLSGVADSWDKRQLLSAADRKVLSRNAIFENRHRRQRAFVIVNGPSLKRQNLQLLERDLTFVVSGFWKHPVLQSWQPTYYSILDKAFFTDEENIRQFYTDLKAKVTNTTYFLPLFRGLDANNRHRYLPLDKTFYVATYGDPFPSVDLTRPVQGFQSVSSFALAQAIYMGCNPIYLLGFDHDFLAHRDIDHHFYDGCVIQGHKNAYTPLSTLASYDSEMEAMLRLWKNYRTLSIVAQRAGIEIINLTDGGYLDVFPRQQYTSLTFES